MTLLVKLSTCVRTPKPLQVRPLPRLHPAAREDLQCGARGGESFRDRPDRIGQVGNRVPQISQGYALACLALPRQVSVAIHQRLVILLVPPVC